MSTLDIEAIKARLVEFVRRFTGDVTLLSAETAADIAALLAEVEALRKELKNTRELCAINGEVADDALDEAERLQRERAEWCDRADVLMTEHMTQMRDLTAENAKLRARLVVDDAMVERAAKAYNDTLYDDIHGPVRRWIREVLAKALNG